MISEEELAKKIDEITSNYKGRIDYLYEAVGLVVMGRLYGWRVMRLCSSRRTWMFANELFGDVKKILPERGIYAHRSVGLKIADKVGGYWEMIAGAKPAIPMEQRKIAD